MAVGDVLIADVLQRFRSDVDYGTAKSLMSSLMVVAMLGEANAITCAENQRALRKGGLTIPRTIDFFLATCCIQNNGPLLSQETDLLPALKSA